MLHELLDLEHLRRLFFVRKGYLVYNMIQLMVILGVVVYVSLQNTSATKLLR